MNPLEIFDFIKAVFAWDGEKVAALMVGILIGATALWMASRMLGRGLWRRDGSEVKELRRDLDLAKVSERHLHNLLVQRDAERDEFKTKVKELSVACETLKEAQADLALTNKSLEETLEQKIEEWNKRVYAARAKFALQRQQIEQFSKQMRLVTEQEGKFWERPPGADIPKFRTLDATRPPIIAVVNLKGGVGKTTLTANLGATLWSRGYRVLLVDLDNQGSLTSLCLSKQDLLDLDHGPGRYVHHLFQPHANPGELAWNLRTRVGNSEGYILAAGEALGNLEEHAKASWLMQPEARDVRYDLRASLHDPLIQNRFDIILLDCPPKLSTACINALTTCDQVLVPVLPDKVSAQNVPRLLKWLRHLKERGICPELSVLGVIANGTNNKNRLTMKEMDLLGTLEAQACDEWTEAVHFFQRFIPKSALFAAAAVEGSPAAFDDGLRPLFLDLLNELQERMPIHASSRPAKIRA